LSASSTDLRSEGRAITPPLSVELPGRRWVLALVLVVLTGACTVWVINSPVFRLRDLRVEGARHLSAADVRRLAGLTSGTNVVWTSGPRVAARLERDPWVRSATVEKRLPAGMVVTIVERTPVARVAGSGGRSVLVSADGVVLPGRAASGDVPLLKASRPVAGPTTTAASLRGLETALRAVTALPSTVRAQVTSATQRPDGTVELELDRGTVVAFGDGSDAVEKGRVLRSLLMWSAGHGVTPHSIDVEVPTAPALLPS
jgi:cell division protein FtsQ